MGWGCYKHESAIDNWRRLMTLTQSRGEGPERL